MIPLAWSVLAHPEHLTGAHSLGEAEQFLLSLIAMSGKDGEFNRDRRTCSPSSEGVPDDLP